MRNNSIILLLITFLSFHTNDIKANTIGSIQETYGYRDGMALVMNVRIPESPNGAGVVMVVSGGFRSSQEQANSMEELSKPLSDRGYTLFFVMHGSAPRYAALDAIADIRRAVRYIRHNAERFGIDGNRIGITGGSSGGETSLCIATQADDGLLESDDPVERESSRVNAVACFFPLTDFVEWDFNHDEYGLGPKQRANISPFAHMELNEATGTYEFITDSNKIAGIAKSLSPYYYIDSNTPPVFIAHGDADAAIALDQSTRFIERMKSFGIPAEMIVKQGGVHGKWDDMPAYYEIFADWYDKYLK